MMLRTTSLGVWLALTVGCGGVGARDASAPASQSAAGAPFMQGAEAPATDAPGAPSPATEAAAAPSEGAAKTASLASSAGKASAIANDDRPLEPIRPERPRAGQLTAGVWDDNLNFGFFGPYVREQQERDGELHLFTAAEMARARDLALASHGAKTQLDVQLVLDTTGSMGDELSYLQSEFDAIAGAIERKFPQIKPRWSLVVYRDRGDDYVTRQFDFTANTGSFRSDLRAQSAGGGGDFPEAVVQAWRASMQQSWRSESSAAKIAFWVADAPTHRGEGSQLAQLAREAEQRGVHVYPIASSGIDETAEFQMRSVAQRTGGRYVFLTDDSGVGNSHAEPHIPCYSVAKLDATIVRMIESEITGQHVRPAASEIVRSVGNPDRDGKCKLQNRTLVASY